MSRWIDVVLGATGTTPAEPAPSLSRHHIEKLGFSLPPAHIELLFRSNGVRLYDGYFQLFPTQAANAWTIMSWNEPSTWKFAWPDGIGEYLCFGETVWGDQYAYRRDVLNGGATGVYFLDALRMQPRQLSETFEEFGERYLVRNATSPFDSVLRAAHDLVGPIEPGMHLVFNPPLLVTGEERLDRLVRMPAREAMILNGDLWSQLANPPSGSHVHRMKVVKDEEGRERMHVEWAPT